MWPRAWNLLGIVLLFHFSKGLQDCGDIRLSASVIHLGASITASCTVTPNCSSLAGVAKGILWKLDWEKLPEGWQYQREDGTLASNITLPHLNRPRAMLSCCLLVAGTPQIIGQAELQAGYPPQPPRNFSCIMNLTAQVLTCQWEPGPNTYLTTIFTLKSYNSRSKDNCQSRKQPLPDCVPRDGESQCSIPRSQLSMYQKIDIWVKAENVLGGAESPHLCINPMDVAKLEPPILQAAKARLGPGSSLPQPGCLQLKWEKGRMSKHVEQTCDLRYQRPGELSWVMVSPFLNSDSQHEGEYDLCGLLFATRYALQMRCVRWSLGGQLGGHWSDWSPSLELTTTERRPMVRLDVWWRQRVRKLSTMMMDIQLLWKPVATEESSTRIQGYLVFPSPRSQDGKSPPLCNTTELNCTFQLPEGDQEVTLTAYNTAGESPPTTIIFQECRGASLSSIHTSAPDAYSLWVGWEHPLGQTLPRAYVIEWCLAPAHQEDDCNGNWKTESNGGSTGTLLDENITPFHLYKITVSPLYHGAMGCPQHIYAYSQEKAPSHAPKLKLKHIGRTWAELEWEPGAPELGKSPITLYTVFWTNAQDKGFSIILNASSRSCTLQGLAPNSMYRVHLMASNQAGGINSTDLTVVTIALEEKDINVLLILISLFSVMTFCIISLVCLHKNHKMKNQFWPNVPDPAHSSLGQWIPTILPGETIHLSSLRDSAMPPVSKIIVLKEEEKKPPPQTRGTDEEAKNLPNLVQAYILQGDPFLPEPHPSSNDPIQYGKVMGNQGYQSQHRSPARLYLRTDSTQPLLADLTPSPKLYENMWFQRSPPGSRAPSSQGFPEEDIDDSAFLPHCPHGPLLDFPLLQGLRIEGADGLGSI
ncbi:granulocyte colony-stimulating factor receptor [Dromiciops gliroides]|uniref:granulocyte colony-stimulating factor receptor n=1 Tax=Dromiciops gliroides TaxID=33562 RepID=UPI001CC7947E|nr:granulocyte colony-stimulating factor receptor [Dromiciops gliroides]